MSMTTMGKIIVTLIAVGGSAAAYTAVKSNFNAEKSANTQEDKVEYLADTMRDLQGMPGSASDAEINNWETQMKNLVNPDNQKIALCRLLSTQATMLAMVERAARQSGDQDMIASVQDDINVIPPGSLEDWLFQTARGGMRPAEYVNNECKQQPTVHVLNPGVRRNSQEMRDLEEQCLAAGSC